MHSKVGNATEYNIKPANSGKTPSSAAASTRQEPTPNYGAADDEFPQGTTTASILRQRLSRVCNTCLLGSAATAHMASSYTCLPITGCHQKLFLGIVVEAVLETHPELALQIAGSLRAPKRFYSCTLILHSHITAFQLCRLDTC